MFLKLLNKSRNIVFHVSFRPLALYLPLIDFRLQSLAISPRYQAAVFSVADASSIVLDNSFRKHSAIISSIYFFLIWTWLSDRETLVSVYIQRNPALACDHPVYTTTSCLTSHSLSTQTWKSPSHFIILKTSSMRPPRYYDQDFMAQRWSHQRGSTYFLISVFLIIEQTNKKKKCASAGLWKLM